MKSDAERRNKNLLTVERNGIVFPPPPLPSRGFGPARRVLAVLFILGVFWAGVCPVAAQPRSVRARPKISGEILAHQKEKKLPHGVRADAHARDLLNRGLNPRNLQAEDCALYVVRPLNAQEIVALRGQGIEVHETYVPPVPGKHPNGFYLATVRYDALDLVDKDPRFVRLETTERLSKPLNDLGAIQTHVDDVHNGSGVPARTGAGVKIAIADTGVDLTHADIPTPAEAYDMTDGTGPGTWGTNVANTVSDHGTHVTGIALGRGTLSAGKYKGAAPGAALCFYKIGNDSTGSATETDEVEAINRALSVGCDIFSMSFGGYDTYMDGSSAMCQAIDAAVAGGMACFISAGNAADEGVHYSVNVAPGATSASFAYTTTAGLLPRGATIYFRVIWRDGSAGDANIVMSCSNLDGGESFSLAFSGWSGRGTDAKRYSLKTNQAAGASKTYNFTLQNTATSGTTPKVHVYEISGGGTFNSPDPSYTIGNPAMSDGAIAVGAWTQRRNWTNYQGLGYYFPDLTVGTLAPFSSLGPRIDGTLKPEVVAPGAATISARDSVSGLAAIAALIIDNDGLNLNGSGPANYYVSLGTSMACPHAAGLAALVLEAQPTLTPAQVRQALTSTASQAGSPSNSVGYGLLNALGAVGADFVPPTATMSSSAPNPTKIDWIPVTVALSEPSTNFTYDDVGLVNATIYAFTGSGTDYSFGLIPIGQGTVTASIGAGVFTDAAGNPNAAATPLSRTYDSVAPTVTVDSLQTNDPTPDLTGTVNDASAAISVTVNAQVYSATNRGATWSASVTHALGPGTYNVAVQAADAAGNVGNDASSDELTVVYPVVNITRSIRYPSLQDAVDAANADDEIEAEAWTYNEHVTIGKALMLSSVSGTTTTIVNGGIRVTSDSVIVEGFQIVGGHDSGNGLAAVQIDRTSGHMISKNRLTGPGAAGTGILLTSGTREVSVSDNEVSGWACGVSATSSTVVLVDGNSIYANAVGLASNGLRDSLILSNRFESNTQAGWRCTNAQGYLAGRLNRFEGNALGVEWNGGAVVDARNNWWGDASGPSGGAVDPVTGAPANGSGDPVGANVRFSSWLVGPEPGIEVANPSGGTVAKGENLEIGWTSTDLDENVKIWLEMDGAYYLIANDIADSGSYVWTVNRGPSSSYARIWVMPMTTERVKGASADFVISTPSSVVTQPATGAAWTRGQTGTIQWSAAFFGSARVKIWLEMDANYYLVANDIENTGSYSWPVGRGPSTSYARVWVISMASEAVRGSSGDFTILPAPALTQPNASSVWAVGETRSIEWPQAFFPGRVKIWLEMDGAYYLAANDVENAGAYSWKVNRGPSSSYAKIWVISMTNETIRLASANFQIVQGATITVSTPDTGSNPWRVGDTEQIAWSWTGNPGNVKIWLEMDGGYYLIANNIANTGSYSWKIDRGPSAGYAKIWVISMNSESVRGASGSFQISPRAP